MINSGQYKKRYFINRNQLYQLYIIDNLTISEIAFKLNLSIRTITYLLKREHIKKDRKAVTQTTITNNLKKYGVSCTLQLEEVNKKARNTCIKKYGHEYSLQNKEIYRKVINTNLKKYGVTCTAKVKEFIEKRESTCIKRYGCKNPIQNSKIRKKSYETKKKRHTVNSSKPEKFIKEALEKTFEDVKYQYRSKEYPFNCDFYIPTLDLYIEYQGHWTHGGKAFKGTEDDIKVLNKWKEKSNTKPAYLSAIDVWTIRDPKKREIVKENKLNWIEFFNMDQFIEWINN